MLFSEFQQGTGCRDNEYNHKIYQRLELMYMADDSISKQEIYEYGKKLVDNSDTPEQIALKERIRAEIDQLKDDLKNIQDSANQYERAAREEEDKYWRKTWRERAKDYKDCARRTRQKIRGLQWVLE